MMDEAYLDDSAGPVESYFSWTWHKLKFFYTADWFCCKLDFSLKKFNDARSSLRVKEKALIAYHFSKLDWVAFKGAWLASWLGTIISTAVGITPALLVCMLWIVGSLATPPAILGALIYGTYLGIIKFGWWILLTIPGALSMCTLYAWRRKPPKKPKPESTGQPYR